jgi:glycosyltransferase involved in cell wall biosynthesis
MRWIPLEYLNALFWISALVPLIVVTQRIKIVHVANPPDFIIPAIAWLKLLGTKLIYDMHDLSVETFKGKALSKRSHLARPILRLLSAFERASIALSDLTITTNSSIREYVKTVGAKKPVYVVRNSHSVRYHNTSQIAKSPRSGVMKLGYFGILSDDQAAGVENFLVLAEALTRANVPYRLSVIGGGPGLERLRRMTAQRGMRTKFEFHGFVPLPAAFELIKEFDYGLVTWGDLPKNHLHTAMKVMDYMACAVPVCSLRLREQVASTGGIGIHQDSFEQMAAEMIRVYRAEPEYELLRESTLRHFNGVLAWELQRSSLLTAYRRVLEGADGASAPQGEVS